MTTTILPMKELSQLHAALQIARDKFNNRTKLNIGVISGRINVSDEEAAFNIAVNDLRNHTQKLLKTCTPGKSFEFIKKTLRNEIVTKDLLWQKQDEFDILKNRP